MILNGMIITVVLSDLCLENKRQEEKIATIYRRVCKKKKQYKKQNSVITTKLNTLT